LPGLATERLEWRRLLSDEWAVAKGLLRPTGRLATAIACPHPGGDACPRRVIQHGDGRFVAICGERPQRCDRIDLRQDDIEVLELNASRLADDLRRLFGISASRDQGVDRGRLVQVGDLPLRAGLRLKVVMGFPSLEMRIAVHELPALSVGDAGGVIVTPTGRHVGPLSLNWYSTAMVDLLGFQEDGAAGALDSGLALLGAIKEKALRAAEPADPATWRLPADARWEEVTIQFISDEVINVLFRQTTKRFEPEHLSMKNQRNGRPTQQWELLKIFADHGGTIHPERNPKHQRFLKQKQELSDKLSLSFGLQDDPIPWNKWEQHFRTRFVIRPHNLGRQSQNENSP